MLDYQPYTMLDALSHCANLRQVSLSRSSSNVSSLIMGSMSNMRVLGHSHQESLTQFLTTLLLLLPSHNVNGNI